MNSMLKPLPRPIRVLLIGGHTMMRSGLRMVIDSQPGLTVIGEAANDNEALYAARQCPDIILIDLDQECDNSLALLSQLQLIAKSARVLVITDHRNPKTHLCAMHMGVMGLVLKEKSAEVLIEAIKKVYDGEVWLDGSLSASLFNELLHVDQTSSADPESNKIATLTEREREVVALVCEGLKNRQVGERLFISEVTVRHHLTSIFDKLGVSGRLRLMNYAYSHNLAKLPK